jgi:hypothetical protein
MEEKLSDPNVKKLYGFYSIKGASLCGHSVYKRPDGTKVNVTVVSTSATDSNTFWDDIEFVGEVTECVVPNAKSTYTFTDMSTWGIIKYEK